LYISYVQQLLSKKNAYSLDASTRSMKTGFEIFKALYFYSNEKLLIAGKSLLR